MVVGDALRLICVLQAALILVLLTPPPGSDQDGGFRAVAAKLRTEVLAALHGNPDFLWKLQGGAAVYGACRVLWDMLRLLWVDPSSADSVRNSIILGLLTVLYTGVLGFAVQAAQELVEMRKLRGEQRSKNGELATLRMRGESLEADVQKWKDEAEKLEKQVEAIKKQAGGQADEYMRLMTENKSLQNQLADFDLVLGGSRKKVA